MDVKNFTYNDISFMSFGESIAVKKEIDKVVEENEKLTDMLFDQSIELSLLLGDD